MTPKEMIVMAVISVQASLNSYQILDAVKQLDAEELEHITRETMQLSAQRKSATQFQRDCRTLCQKHSCRDRTRLRVENLSPGSCLLHSRIGGNLGYIRPLA